MIEVIINGEAKKLPSSLTVRKLLEELGFKSEKVALERNREIVPRSSFDDTRVGEGDQIEIVHFIGGGNAPVKSADPLRIAGREFHSRLIVGTGKYKDFEQTAAAIEASGAEIVTVAVRRVNVSDPDQPMLADYVDPKKVHLSAQHRRLLHGG